MSWLSTVADMIGIAGGVFSFFAWIQVYRLRKDTKAERQRLNARIRVILSYGNQIYELPSTLRRAELTRAELLGRLGMIPVKKDREGKEQKRFSISHTNSKEFFERLNDLILGTGNDVLIIPCKKDEFEQFEFNTG